MPWPPNAANLPNYYDPRQIQILYQQVVGMGQPQAAPAAPIEEPDEMPAGLKVANTYKIGCDPEFVAIKADGVPQYVEGILPHDGPVGYDHGGRVIEVRPRASKLAYKVLQNIQALLRGAELQRPPLDECKWRAGALGGREPLGGHIHYDVPYADAGNPQRVQALDLTTRVLELLDILPRAESAERRNNNFGYGRFGDIRPAGHDRARQHLEYRTPASWLFDPRTAFACLTTYKLAALNPQDTMESLNGLKKWLRLRTFWEKFRGRDADATRLLERLIDRRGLRAVRGDPDANLREKWEVLHV